MILFRLVPRVIQAMTRTLHGGDSYFLLAQVRCCATASQPLLPVLVAQMWLPTEGIGCASHTRTHDLNEPCVQHNTWTCFLKPTRYLAGSAGRQPCGANLQECCSPLTTRIRTQKSLLTSTLRASRPLTSAEKRVPAASSFRRLSVVVSACTTRPSGFQTQMVDTVWSRLLPL